MTWTEKNSVVEIAMWLSMRKEDCPDCGAVKLDVWKLGYEFHDDDGYTDLHWLCFCPACRMWKKVFCKRFHARKFSNPAVI